MLIKERIDHLEEYLKRCIEENAFPAASFGLITKNESYFSALGRTQVGHLVKDVDTSTIFDLASLTKVVATTTAIMKLIEDGLLRFNDYVIDILPGYKRNGITIAHLLTHTAGYAPEPDYKNCGNKEELVQRLLDEKNDYDKRDKEVVYSDISFMLLSLIIDRLTGSFDEYTNENILKPLDMNDTRFNPTTEMVSRCAATEKCKKRDEILVGIVHDEKAQILGGVSGHAGLFSTVNDLGKFTQMILNDGVYNGNRILSKPSVDLLSKCQTEGLNVRRGYGWVHKQNDTSIGDLASELAIYHTGFTGTSMLIDKYYKMAFILLTNRVHPTRENTKLATLRGRINNIAMTTVDYEI